MDIREIRGNLRGLDLDKIGDLKLRMAFNEVLALFDSAVDLSENLTDDYFRGTNLDKLREDNHRLYAGFIKGNYNNSLANPVYARESLASDYAQSISYLYSQAWSCIKAAYRKDYTHIDRIGGLLVVAFDAFTKKSSDAEDLKRNIGKYITSRIEEQYTKHLANTYGYGDGFYTQIVENVDLDDLSYLYRFGEYVSEYEIRTAKFLASYNHDKLNNLAQSIVKAYVDGFKRDNKDMSLRSRVRVIGVLGQERLTRMILSHLRTHKLEGHIVSLESTEFNQQFSFDHKFDRGLFLNEEINLATIEAYKNACKNNEKVMRDYSGVLYVERFGQEPFSPVNNDARIKLDESQQKLTQEFQIEQSKTTEHYIPEKERSFCIVAFPSPEIGERFEEIFADIVAINQMDSDVHAKVQQCIIDALDKADYVHVKGYKGNLTDIMVKMQNISDPAKETNFVNCVADVNVPVGEVFTSPTLKGTNGVLHVDTVYLEGFNYSNLRIDFEDGYVKDYECSNFDDSEKGKEFIRENLLFPHKSLPIGEFAIGTNTLAYVVSEKYGIVDKLPILIVEKMGPHFAIGDTCFSWSEDNPVHNPDGKEIIARDNERSILRKEDVSKAYTNCHTDITIPYDSLEFISAVTKEGQRINIIREGRFVLAGTEALNVPFEGREESC